MATKPQTFDETILQRRNIGGSSVNELTLTPEEKRKEQILIAALLVQQPFFANLLLSDTKIVWTDMVETAATDSYHVFFNPKNIFARPLQEQVFILWRMRSCTRFSCTAKWATSSRRMATRSASPTARQSTSTIAT